MPRHYMDKCVHCGLCEKVCPVEHPVYENSETPDVFAAYSARERRRSSSGGMFYAIARYVIGKGGVVFGAAYDKDLRVRHIAAADMAGLEQLRGSKYVQSHVGDAFKEAAAYLKQGRLVYFTGTPCQIAGLKSFLRRRYDNLLTSDLVCHGVPSQWLFDKHLQYLSWREGSKVTSYSFRDGKYWTIREKVDYADGKVSCEFDGNRSPYLYAFGLGYTYRRSCFDCKFARIPRQGDITLADYWGVGRFHPQMDVYAVHLLDPTLLLDAADYPAADSGLPEGGMFCYLINLNNLDDVCFDAIEEYAATNGLPLKVVSCQYSEVFFNRKYLLWPSPQQWLGCYKAARCIVTNTFHGTVFALVYHKPFVAILQGGAYSTQNERIISLLETFNLQHRILRSKQQLGELLETSIDWAGFEVRKSEMKEKTDAFFRSVSL